MSSVAQLREATSESPRLRLECTTAGKALRVPCRLMSDSSEHDLPDEPRSTDPLAPYREAARDLGSGFPATLWASERTQQLRFDVLLDLLGPQRLDQAILLDLGCGDGALALRMKQRGIRVARYVGIDGIYRQVEAAQRRVLERASFVCEDLTQNGRSLGRFGAGVAIISGTLNTMAQAQAQTLVREAFEAVSGAVCFNFLSDRPVARRREADLGPAIRHDVIRWLDFALGLTSLVSFRQDHLEGHDAAILLAHET